MNKTATYVKYLLTGLIAILLVTIGLNYKAFVAMMPAGKLFSWQAVFDAVPTILNQLPITLGLTLAGSFFGLILALIFAIVKINRVPGLYQIQAVFVSF